MKNLRKYMIILCLMMKARWLLSLNIIRTAKKGEIIKIGKGKFNKRASSIKEHIIPQVINHPRDKVALRHNKISPSKYPIFSKLFWSNRNVAISLDSYIGVILSKR